MVTDITPREHVEKVLRAYDRARLRGLTTDAAEGWTSGYLGIPVKTVRRALNLRIENPERYSAGIEA